jgi:MFS family permease
MFLLVGRLSDLFGRRWFFILGNVIGLVSAVIGATAQNVNQLIAGNTLSGIAAAVQISVTAAIGELVPNKDRLVWVMFILGVNPLPFAAFGPIIAHKFVTSTGAGWRWSFYLNIITTGLATILLFIFYHPPTFKMLHQNRSKREQIRRLDYVGIVLFTAGLILFIMGLSWGGNMYPWKSAHVIAPIVVGALLLIAFGFWEFFFTGDALLPMHLLRIRGYISIVITATVGSCVYYSMNIIWPQEIAALFTSDPTQAGWLACTVGGATLVGQISGALALRYIGHQRTIYISASVGLTAFAGALASVNPGEVHKGVAFMFLSCMCVGIIELSALALAPLVCPPEEIGVATGTLGSIRSAGSTVASKYLTVHNR